MALELCHVWLGRYIRGGIRFVSSVTENTLGMWRPVSPLSLLKSSRNFRGCHWVENEQCGWMKCVNISAGVLGQGEPNTGF